ncbi:Probable glycine dehydrogenase (decarboxylating) subunit 2 [Aduncisulcus paluster]|uniref:glycine dehydrogenase (aminomethyl-transferring) n=1 Tax=Aduncisulcus paluster TaxID=2918883 RepID=A0ABQ5JR44_9EUKA|nr:Probable glycine dehydrogenase (decarboxylating) subunit 2 [Aduncisulcus paluster]
MLSFSSSGLKSSLLRSFGAKGLQIEEQLLFEYPSCDGRSGFLLEEEEVKCKKPSSLGDLERKTPIDLPCLSEPQVTRHYTRLSTKNFSLDHGMYPLGSCTMKYNPRLNEHVAALPGFSDIHPLQPLSTVQGALRVLQNVGDALLEITGMDGVHLSAAAGAHGELTGLMTIRQALVNSGDIATKNVILIPESAHGTNPATAAMCGFETVVVPARKEDGCVDVECVRDLCKKHNVAAIMVTNPSTLGMFEKDIKKIADVMHENGGYLYMDGANLNALMGKAKIADFGVDALHINVHKTLSTPHAGGGPGAGPVVFSKALSGFMPSPNVHRLKDGTLHISEHPHLTSSGRVKQFHGQFNVLVKTLAYILALGGRGIRQVSEDAVMNANYLLSRLTKAGMTPAIPGRRCMHEFVLSDKFLKDTGASTMDIAKGLLDNGFHPMTVYFPLIVSGAMLIEPTESESLETLDEYCEILSRLMHEAKTDGEKMHHYPSFTPIKRCDEVLAAKKPILSFDDIPK